MLRDADPKSFAGIYIVCGFTDMRYGIDTLAAIIDSRYHLPLVVPGTLFLFCGHRANKIKGLVWEGDGFLLLTKRVESGRFTWPRTSNEARAITPKQFEWLMEGFGIDPIIRLFMYTHPNPMMVSSSRQSALLMYSGTVWQPWSRMATRSITPSKRNVRD